jgi:hypothetical protein
MFAHLASFNLYSAHFVLESAFFNVNVRRSISLASAFVTSDLAIRFHAIFTGTWV